MWLYGAIMVGSFACAMATCCEFIKSFSHSRLFDLSLTFFPFLDTGGSQLPWWALIVALILSLFMFPFVCVIYAVTGFVSLTSFAFFL